MDNARVSKIFSAKRTTGRHHDSEQAVDVLSGKAENIEFAAREPFFSGYAKLLHGSKCTKGYRMNKKAKNLEASADVTGLEGISVKIGSKSLAIYKGLGGTFASFTDSCLRKQTLPGFHEKGLLAEAEPKEAGIVLCLSGKHNATKLQEIMDIALLNTGAYPDSGGKAQYFIEVKSEK
jgi:hypothetical protein